MFCLWVLLQCCGSTTKEDSMAKEAKHRKDVKKKPSMSLKERRAKKHEKKQHKQEHFIEPNVDHLTE